MSREDPRGPERTREDPRDRLGPAWRRPLTPRRRERRFGLRIVERVPSHVAPNPNNIKYLRTKEERMGHLLDLADKIDPGGVGGDAI